MRNISTRTAHAQMISSVPVIRPDWTISSTRDYFEDNISSFESIRYLYVVSDENKLLGVISIKDMYRNPLGKKIKDIFKEKSIITVSPNTSQGKVAYLALKHNIKAVPVVDSDMTFLGVVPSDKILSIVYHEARTTLMRFGGVHSKLGSFEGVLDTPIFTSFRHRVPWLIIGIFGGLLSAAMIDQFEPVLQRNLVLASFIPLIVYMSSAVGTQMEAYIIREQALEEKFSFLKYFLKQLAVTLMIAVICSLILLFFVLITTLNISISIVLGTSLFFAISSAIITGLFIPFVLYKLRIDPAAASGPLATIIQDITSVVIYLGIASSIL